MLKYFRYYFMNTKAFSCLISLALNTKTGDILEVTKVTAKFENDTDLLATLSKLEHKGYILNTQSYTADGFARYNLTYKGWEIVEASYAS